MAIAPAYVSKPDSCPHRGEVFPITTPHNPFVFAVALDSPVCARCGRPAVPALGGLYHPAALPPD